MWLIFRESGSATQTVLTGGVLHAGGTGYEINDHFLDYECRMYDPIMLYAKLTRPHDL